MDASFASRSLTWRSFRSRNARCAARFWAFRRDWAGVMSSSSLLLPPRFCRFWSSFAWVSWSRAPSKVLYWMLGGVGGLGTLLNCWYALKFWNWSKVTSEGEPLNSSELVVCVCAGVGGSPTKE